MEQLSYRTIQIRRSDEPLFMAVAATETPVEIEPGLFEVLKCSAGCVRMARLLSGHAPVFTEHDHDVKTQVGVIEDAKLEIEGLITGFRISETEKKLKQKIEEKIIRNVSIGYVIHAQHREGPNIIVSDWEPLELSIVGIPKDVNAYIRKKEFGKMEDKEKEKEERELLKDGDKDLEKMVETDVEVREDEKKKEEEEEREMDKEEIKRSFQICSVAGMNIEDAQNLVFSKRSLSEVIDAVAKTRKKQDPQIRGRSVTTNEVSMRSMVTDALYSRMQGIRPQGAAESLYGLTLVDIARRYMESQGVSLRGMDRWTIAGRAFHTTSDFPNILADVANKFLLDRYKPAPSTYEPFIRTRRVSDFKNINLVSLGDIGELVELEEGEEYSRVSIGETGDSYALRSFGKIIGFTRKMLINDDLSAFDQIPGIAQQRVQDLKSKLFWEQITSNPVMYDGDTLFHANHGNYESTPAAISITSISAARLAMRKQKGHESKSGLDDGMYIVVNPVWLVVPPEKETVAEQFVSPLLYAASSANINVFSQKLKVMAEPRLSDNSDVDWYVFGEASQIPMVEMAVLEGQEAPKLEHQVKFSQDALELKISYDCAAKVVDYRGFYKQEGS